MYCPAPFTLFCQLTCAIIVHKNVAFHKTNETALKQSKWLSTFIIDTQPYTNYYKRLTEDLRQAEVVWKIL